MTTFDRATVCLPTGDRAASHAFYTALGFRPVGELADDGIPEPLQFEVNAGLRVMFIPTGGFGWVTGDRTTAPSDTHECLLVVGLATTDAVDDLMRRAHDAGAEIVFAGGNQAWGEARDDGSVDAYAGCFADPDGHLWQVSLDDGVLVY